MHLKLLSDNDRLGHWVQPYDVAGTGPIFKGVQRKVLGYRKPLQLATALECAIVHYENRDGHREDFQRRTAREGSVPYELQAVRQAEALQ